MDEKRAASVIVGRRVIAGLIDVVLWAVILVLAALRFGTHTAGSQGANLSLTGVPFVIYLVALLIYFVLLEWLWSRTLGKLLLGLRVMGLDNARITLVQSLVRNIFRAIDGFPYFIPYLLGFLIITANPQKRRLGDLLARTYISK